VLPGWECVEGPDGVQVYVNHDTRETTFQPPPPAPEVDKDVFVIEDASMQEFDSFLSVFYPEDFNLGDLFQQDEWVRVLRLASAWSFPTVRSRALRELDAIVSPFDRLIIARTHTHDPWIDIALRGLCSREEPLSAEEMLQMNLEDVAFIMKARESVRGPVDEERAADHIDGLLALRRLSREVVDDAGTQGSNEASRLDNATGVVFDLSSSVGEQDDDEDAPASEGDDDDSVGSEGGGEGESEREEPDGEHMLHVRIL